MKTAHPQRIAIVEDEFPTAQLLRDVVEEIGHEVGHAVYYRPPDLDDGFWRKPPDLVLSDVYFGGEPTGLPFCRALAERAIPFFLVSAGEATGLLALLGDLQPLGLIHKPLRPDEIFSRIELALGGPRDASPARGPALMLRDRSMKVSVPLAEVTHIQSDRNNCIVYARGRRFVKLATLGGIVGKYAAEPIARIHRSYVVHLDHVRGYNASEVALDEGTRLPIGRSYRAGFVGRMAAHPTRTPTYPIRGVPG